MTDVEQQSGISAARRVIVGPDSAGCSHVTDDREVSAQISIPACAVVDLWKGGVPADLTRHDDGLGGEWSLEPSVGGYIVRLVELRPDDEWKPALLAAGDDDAAAGFHQTDTLDLVVVLDGEVTCVLDDGEVALTAGEVLVQVGTNHAWSVRNNRPCRMLAVLLRGQR